MAEPPVLVVSPHLDDAVLSCFGLLDAADSAEVLTICTGRPHPPRIAWSERAMGFPDSDATMTARLAEDDAALAGLASGTRRLGLLDEDYLDGPRPRADGDVVRAAVAAWLSEHPGGRVAVPAGAGRVVGRVRSRIERVIGPRGGVTPHPDHVFVRDAVVVMLVRRQISELVLYEELPYLWHGSADAAVRRVARRASAAAELRRVPVDPVRKAQRIACYASQLEHLALDGRRLERPATVPGFERYGLLAC